MDIVNFTDPETNLNELGVREGMYVADFGAGVGAYTIPLARLVGEYGRVYAVEVQKEFLINIRSATDKQGFSNIEVLWGDIEQLGGTKIKDATVDAVVISNVLFQAEDKPGLIREAKRILKLGGKILIVDWKESFGNLGPTKDAVVPVDTARMLCEKEGFTEKKEFNAGAHHYGIIMFK